MRTLACSMLAAALAAALFSDSAGAANEPEATIRGENGPAKFYSHGGECENGETSGGPADPVGVIFEGRRSGPSNVSKFIGAKTGWENTATGIHAHVHIPWPVDEDVDINISSDKQGLRVKEPNGSYVCHPNNAANAEGSQPVRSRFHVRLWYVPGSAGGDNIETVGTPHHEDWIWHFEHSGCELLNNLGIGNHAVDEGGVSSHHPNGQDSGFDRARRQLKSDFENHGFSGRIGSENWGNTNEHHQCDGGWAGSDGWGIVIPINNSLHPHTAGASSVQGESADLHGSLSTEETAEYWFGYGTSSSQGPTGYPNSTSVRTTSAAPELNISEDLSGLQPGAVYYVRLFARNSAGEVEEGNETSFSSCNWGPAAYDDSPGPHPIVGCVDSRHIFYRTPAGTLGHDWNFLGEWGWGNETLDGSVGGEPHVTQDDAGSLNVFYRTPSGGLGHNWWKWGDPWGSDVLPGEVAGDPHPVILSDGSRHIFYRTPSGQLGQTWNKTAEWGWNSEILDGQIAGEPQPVISSGDSIDVFYRTPQGALGHNWWTSGQGWGSDILPGEVSGDPHPIELSNDSRHIFYRTPQGGLGHDWNFLGEWGWGSETLDGSLASEPFPTKSSGDSIDVFYRTPSNTLGHNWWTWGDPWGHDTLPGEVAGNPRPVELHNDARHIFYRTPQGGLGHDWNFLGEWGWGHEVLDGSVASDPHPVVNSSDSIDVFYRDPAGGMGHNWWHWGDPWGHDTLPGSITDGHPSATTGNASNVTRHEATLSGTVNPNGGRDTTYRFEWGTTTAYGHSAPVPDKSIDTGNTSVAVSESIEGLAELTEYHFRLVATNVAGTTYGSDGTFKTKGPPPSVNINAAPRVLSTFKATLKGSVNPYGSDTKYRFEYGLSESYGSSVPATDQSIGSGQSFTAVEQTISGLSPSTVYHYRLRAENEFGVTYSSDGVFRSFGTPIAKTEEALVEGATASLKGFVRPEGFYTTYQFEYGTSVQYGKSIPLTPKYAAGGSFGAYVTQQLSDLETATTYHYRLRASNAEGVGYGEDRTFETESAPATGPTPPPDLSFGEEGSGEGQFLNPAGLDVGAEGDLWVADANNNRVEHFSPEGEYLGQFGEKGSGQGQLNSPFGVAVDAEGGLWVADTFNNRVEHFSPEGEYLGQFGEEGLGDGQLLHPRGIALDSEGDIWVADTNNNRVERFSPEGEYLGQFGEKGSGEGQLSGPYGVAVDSEGDIWVADTGNNRVERFSPEGEYLGQFGEQGTGEGQLLAPFGVAVNPEGDLWVANTFNSRVDRFSPEGEYLGQFGEAGSGEGQLRAPGGVAVDSEGDIWVADTYNNRVQQWSPLRPPAATTEAATSIDPRGATLHAAITPNGTDTYYRFEYGTSAEYGASIPVPAEDIGSGDEPIEVSRRIDGLQVGTTYHFRVVAENDYGDEAIGADRTFTTAVSAPVAVIGHVTDVTPTGATLHATVNPEGSSTTYQFGYSSGGSEGSAPQSPEEIGSGAAPVEVSERIEGLEPDATYHFQVSAESSEGSSSSEYGEFQATSRGPSHGLSFGEEGSGEGQLLHPSTVAVDPEGDIWVADTGNNRVERFNPEGEYLSQVGKKGSAEGQLSAPFGIAVDPEGDIWVADTGNNRVERFSPEGEFLSQIGEEGSGDGQLLHPRGIALDSEGDIWVADTNNNRVERFSPEGEYLGQFGEQGTGEGQLSGPYGIAVDPEGDIWVADTNNNRVERFSPEGEYLGQFGEQGTGEGQLRAPGGVAVNPAGDLWVANTFNSRVDRFSPGGEYLGQFGEAGSGEGQLRAPGGVAVDPEGDLWVADTYNNRVQQWSPLSPPAATTEAATSIDPRGATLHAAITPNGTDTYYRFEYGTSAEYGASIPVPAEGVGSGMQMLEVARQLGGLQPGAVYHFRVVAESEFGSKAFGEDETFATALPPVVSTGAASEVGVEAATLHATVNPQGMSTTYRFEYGRTKSYGSYAPITAQGIGSSIEDVAVAQAVEDLESGSLYHFRISATNSAGTSRSEDETLVTESAPPAVSTEAASGVTETAATLHGTVNPEGPDAHYRFEYVDQAEFEATGFANATGSPEQAQDIGSGREDVEVGTELEGLESGVTYHFRLEATSARGTTFSEERQFSTTAPVASFDLSFGEEGSGEGQLLHPRGIAVDPEGDLWVADYGNNRVDRFRPEGEYLGQFGEKGSGQGQLNSPFGVAVDAEGDLWVADTGNSRVEHFSADGEFLSQFGEEGSAEGQLLFPVGVAVDPEGDLWVADTFNSRLEHFSPEGEYLGQLGEAGSGEGQLAGPFGVAVDPEGDLWVVDYGNNRVERFSPEGEYLGQFGEEGSGEGQFLHPTGIALDPEGDVWVADLGNNRVEWFSPEGEFLGQFGEKGSGEGQLLGPTNIAFGAEGDIWVVDNGNNRVERWSPN